MAFNVKTHKEINNELSALLRVVKSHYQNEIKLQIMDVISIREFKLKVLRRTHGYYKFLFLIKIPKQYPYEPMWAEPVIVCKEMKTQYFMGDFKSHKLRPLVDTVLDFCHKFESNECQDLVITFPTALLNGDNNVTSKVVILINKALSQLDNPLSNYFPKHVRDHSKISRSTFNGNTDKILGRLLKYSKVSDKYQRDLTAKTRFESKMAPSHATDSKNAKICVKEDLKSCKLHYSKVRSFLDIFFEIPKCMNRIYSLDDFTIELGENLRINWKMIHDVLIVHRRSITDFINMVESSITRFELEPYNIRNGCSLSVLPFHSRDIISREMYRLYIQSFFDTLNLILKNNKKPQEEENIPASMSRDSDINIHETQEEEKILMSKMRNLEACIHETREEEMIPELKRRDSDKNLHEIREKEHTIGLKKGDSEAITPEKQKVEQIPGLKKRDSNQNKDEPQKLEVLGLMRRDSKASLHEPREEENDLGSIEVKRLHSETCINETAKEEEILGLKVRDSEACINETAKEEEVLGLKVRDSEACIDETAKEEEILGLKVRDSEACNNETAKEEEILGLKVRDSEACINETAKEEEILGLKVRDSEVCINETAKEDEVLGLKRRDSGAEIHEAVFLRIFEKGRSFIVECGDSIQVYYSNIVPEDCKVSQSGHPLKTTYVVSGDDDAYEPCVAKKYSQSLLEMKNDLQNDVIDVLPENSLNTLTFQCSKFISENIKLSESSLNPFEYTLDLNPRNSEHRIILDCMDIEGKESGNSIEIIASNDYDLDCFFVKEIIKENSEERIIRLHKLSQDNDLFNLVKEENQYLKRLSNTNKNIWFLFGSSVYTFNLFHSLYNFTGMYIDKRRRNRHFAEEALKINCQELTIRRCHFYKEFIESLPIFAKPI